MDWAVLQCSGVLCCREGLQRPWALSRPWLHSLALLLRPSCHGYQSVPLSWEGSPAL